MAAQNGAVLSEGEVVDRRRRGWSLVAALLAGGTLALTAALVFAAPQRSFLHIATNLSQAPYRWSHFADIAVSPDGDRVAVVWPEAYSEGGAPYGSVWLRWASESTGGGWSNRAEVFAGSFERCATWAAVAVTGTTAHIAYVVQEPCQAAIAQKVVYRPCTLGGDCAAETVITSTVLANAVGFTRVDIALDQQENPHFVYVYYRKEAAADVGTVYYRWLVKKELKPEERVSGSTQNASSPAIAVFDGYIHATWAVEPYGSYNWAIYYRRRPLGEDQSWATEKRLVEQTTYAARNPAIAAYTGTVFVVWDMAANPGHTQFSLGYNHSMDHGLTWQTNWREVETDGQMTQDQKYVSTDSQDMWEYLRCLQPAVALDGAGRPTVVWHADRGSQGSPDYDIYYVQGLTVTQFGTSWSTSALLSHRTDSHSGSPAVAIAPVLSPSLHVAYGWYDEATVDWETFYDSNEYADYPKVFLPVIFRNFSGGGET